MICILEYCNIILLHLKTYYGVNMDPKRRLSDIEVVFISLVDKGANKKKIVFKSDNLPEDPPIFKTIEILKFDAEKQMVYGIVYSPEETDSQGDIASESEIEKAAYGFMKYRRSGQIDKMHNKEAEEGFTAESWITRKDDALFKDDAPIGSWAVGIKIEKDETWGEVKDKKLTGLSLMGSASVEQLAKSQDSWLSTLIEKMGLKKGKFKDKILASKARRMVWDLTDAFQEGVNEIMSDKFKGDKKDALSKMVIELQEYVEKEFPGDLVKAGRKISGLNTKTIQSAIDALNNLLESVKLEKTEESEMTDEDIKTSIVDGIAEGIKKVAEDLKKDLNTKFDKAFADMKDTVAKHETAFAELKKSAGSDQQEGQETDEDEIAELAKKNQYKDEKGKIRNHTFA